MMPPGYFGPARPFGLTQCVYAADAPLLGPLACLVTLSPVYVMVAYVVLLASRRDLATASLLLGQLLNEAANFALKRALRQPRPFSQMDRGPLGFAGPRYGMPSDHAQFVGFLAAYALLWAARCWRAPRALRHLAAAGVLLAAAAVAATRVYLRLHTPAQVGVGLAVGAALGGGWFALVQALLRRHFHAIAASRLGRALQLRDLTLVDDVLALEYTASIEAAALARTRAARRAAAREGGATPPRDVPLGAGSGAAEERLFDAFEGGHGGAAGGADEGGEQVSSAAAGGAYRRKAR